VAKETSNNGMLYKQDAVVDGKTIPQWSEEWLKWIAHAPASTPPGTPFPPTDGASPDNALVNNNGDVFFLYGGDWGNSHNPYTPVIDVPAHKPIFVPMINAFDIEGPNIETISGFYGNRGSYADEARFVTGLAEKSI
jgi:hypothetical protein